jgi:hypothetical protein
MNTDQLVSAIENGNFAVSDLDRIGNAIKFARSKLASRTANSLFTGATAYVTHPKLGGRQQVTIERIKIKKADVCVVSTGRRFVVPLSMIETA